MIANRTAKAACSWHDKVPKRRPRMHRDLTHHEKKSSPAHDEAEAPQQTDRDEMDEEIPF